MANASRISETSTAVGGSAGDAVVLTSRFDDRSADTIVPLADLFRLLGDPTRLRIVLACVDGRRAVGEIAEALGLSPSLVSHHLRLLRAARIVRAERQGKQVFYAAADRHISAMLSGMLEHVAEPASDFPADAT